MLRTSELQLCVQRNLQRPRYAVNSSDLGVSRALYDLLLPIGWCCMEAAATTGVCVLVHCLLAECPVFFMGFDGESLVTTGVCAGSLLACRIFFFFCMGFRRGIACFCRQVLKLRLNGLSTRDGSRVIRTATNYDYRVHS